MKKQFKKLWLFPMLAALFMLTNCQEDYTEDSGHGHNVNSQVVRKPFKDFKNLPRLLDKALKAKLTKARDTTDIYNFQIDSTEVMEITTDQGKFYTMSITRDFDYPVDMFENLVISDYGTKIEAFIVSYQPDADYYNRVATHKYAPFTGGISTTIINYENIEKGVITTCITYSVIACAKDADPHPIDGSCVLYVNTITDCTTYIFQSPVIGTSVLPSKLVNLKLSSGGGGGSSPGGGGSGGTIPGNTTNQGGGNAGPLTPSLSGPVTGPVLPSQQQKHEKNCVELANFSANPKILAKLQDVENTANDVDEDGYSYSDDQDPKALEKDPKSGDVLVIVPSGGLIYGASHDHPNPSSTDWMPMFSISDIASLGMMAAKNQEFPKPVNKFIFTLTVNQGGAKQTFALKIDDYVQFISFVSQYYSSEDIRKAHRIDLASLYSKVDRIYGTTGLLKVLLKYMKMKNIKGVSIYKANDTFSEWTKMEYDQNNEIKETPCK